LALALRRPFQEKEVRDGGQGIIDPLDGVEYYAPCPGNGPYCFDFPRNRPLMFPGKPRADGHPGGGPNKNRQQAEKRGSAAVAA